MQKEHDKLMRDLTRLLDEQNFKSVDEMQEFLDNIVGEPIPGKDRKEMTPHEQAQDLIYDAYDLPADKMMENIELALQLDPDCIEAFELLGNIEPIPQIALAFFEKSVSLGRKRFGREYLEENKGDFWGLYETRSFMRCMQQYSEYLYVLNKKHECVAILEEMIELNPGDNQGVRDQLLLYLIELEEFKKFRKYDQQYKEQDSAFPLFNRALFTFKTKGKTPTAIRQLKEARVVNKFVVPKLLTEAQVSALPASYAIGSEDEANYYIYFAYTVWWQTPSAISWLKSINKK